MRSDLKDQDEIRRSGQAIFSLSRRKIPFSWFDRVANRGSGRRDTPASGAARGRRLGVELRSLRFGVMFRLRPVQTASFPSNHIF